MKRELTFARLLLVAGAIGLLALAARALPVAAQQAPDCLGVVDRDFGRRLRHAPAYRGQLNVIPSLRAGSGRPQWNVRLFDHPTPSFPFFQQERGLTLRYQWGAIGLDPYIYRDGWSPGRYSAYGVEYYAPPDPPRRRCWGRGRGW
jgi:hypothetical protein